MDVFFDMCNFVRHLFELFYRFNLHVTVCCSGSYGLEPYLEVKTVRIVLIMCHISVMLAVLECD